MARLSRVTWVYALLAGAAFVLVGVLAVRLAGLAPSLPAPGGGDPGRAVLGSEGCLSCHTVSGQGGSMGPPLGAELAARGEAWIRDYLTSGRHIDVYPGNGHRAFRDLSPDRAGRLARYLASLTVSGAYQGHPDAPRPGP